MVMVSHIALHRDRRCVYSAPPPSREGMIEYTYRFDLMRIVSNQMNWFVSMKRYAAVKVRGGSDPQGRMLGRAGPVGPLLLESSRLTSP